MKHVKKWFLEKKIFEIFLGNFLTAKMHETRKKLILFCFLFPEFFWKLHSRQNYQKYMKRVQKIDVWTKNTEMLSTCPNFWKFEIWPLPTSPVSRFTHSQRSQALQSCALIMSTPLADKMLSGTKLFPSARRTSSFNREPSTTFRTKDTAKYKGFKQLLS